MNAGLAVVMAVVNLDSISLCPGRRRLGARSTPWYLSLITTSIGLEPDTVDRLYFSRIDFGSRIHADIAARQDLYFGVLPVM